MLSLGGMLAIAGCARVGRNPLTFMEDFHRPGRDPHPELPFDQLVRHRVIMPVHVDVVIDPGPALFPFRVDIWLFGQRPQSWFVQVLKQGTATGTQMPGDLGIELIT